MDKPSPRGVSLKYCLVVLTVFSIACTLLKISSHFESAILLYSGLACLGVTALLVFAAAQRCWRYTALATALLILAYVGTYAGLSVNGKYEGILLGAGHIKTYAWAPAGFARDGVWNLPILYAFGPLWGLDNRCWHPRQSGSYTGPLPVNNPYK